MLGSSHYSSGQALVVTMLKSILFNTMEVNTLYGVVYLIILIHTCTHPSNLNIFVFVGWSILGGLVVRIAQSIYCHFTDKDKK